MGRYLTPGQLALDTQGIDVSAIPARELSRIIFRAETDIDTYCGAIRHDPHMVMGETHPWRYLSRRIGRVTTPVPITRIDRLRIAVSSQPNTGNLLVATISPNDVVVNNTGGWCEVVSMQALTYSLTPALINLGLNTIVSIMDYEVGWLVPWTGVALEPTGVLGQYQDLRGHWSLSPYVGANVTPYVAYPTPTIYANGTAYDPSTYTLDPVEGIVTFKTPLPAAVVVTADYTATIPDDVQEATRLAAIAQLEKRAALQAGLAGMQSVAIPGEAAVTRAEAAGRLPQDARQRLRNYRHLAVG